MDGQEQKTKRKFLGIIKSVFKYLWLILLVLLLAGAIWFQTPLKITAFIVIFLLASTVLPRPLRKWFWLGVCAIALMLIIWVFMPSSGNWKPYKYDFEQDLAALGRNHVITDEENAATIYNKLFEQAIFDGNEPEFFTHSEPSSISGPWLSSEHQQMANWLQLQSENINSLMLASGRRLCQFKLWTSYLEEMPERQSKMRRCAQLLLAAANNDVAEGRTEQWMEKCLCILRMAEHCRQQPTRIDMLIGTAIEPLAIEQFKTFVVTDNPTEGQLTTIEEALGYIEHDWSRDLPIFIVYDKIMFKSLLSTQYEINQSGKTRLSQDPFVEIRKMFRNMDKDLDLQRLTMPPTYWQKKAMKALTILTWFVMPSTPQKAGKIVDKSFDSLYAMAESDFDWQKELQTLPTELTKSNFRQIKLNFRYFARALAGILIEPYYKIHDLCLRAIANKNGARIMIALRRHKNKHGRWPERLEQIENFLSPEILVDPLNNSSFIYKLTEDGFTLYSKGKNNLDEDGTRDRWGKKTGADDQLIWPLRKSETQEEKTNDEKH